MQIIFDAFNFIISRPLGYILYWCYFITRNYGLSLVLFTLVTRFFLWPLAVKQQKSSAEMLRMQPKLAAIQKKYAKDKQKLQEEQMKLYQEEGYNPMGGCLPMLIQLPILWGLFNVIYKPYTYILNYSPDTIKQLVTALKDPLIKIAAGAFGKDPTIATMAGNQRVEIFLAGLIPKNMDIVGSILPKSPFNLDFNFLGLTLTQTPNFTSVYILIPIICYATSLISTWMSMKMNQMTQGAGAAAATTAGMNKSMLIIMPFVSAGFSLSVPSGVGLYWIITNLFMMLQVVLLNKFYNPKVLAEKAEIRAEERKAKKRLNNPAPEPEPEIEEPAEEKREVRTDLQPKKVNTSGKKTKKQLMEENRKRLSAARESENGKKEE